MKTSISPLDQYANSILQAARQIFHFQQLNNQLPLVEKRVLAFPILDLDLPEKNMNWFENTSLKDLRMSFYSKI
jgi:hypothetical protein